MYAVDVNPFSQLDTITTTDDLGPLTFLGLTYLHTHTHTHTHMSPLIYTLYIYYICVYIYICTIYMCYICNIYIYIYTKLNVSYIYT